MVLSDPARQEAGPEFPDLVIDPRRIWEVSGLYQRPPLLRANRGPLGVRSPANLV